MSTMDLQRNVISCEPMNQEQTHGEESKAARLINFKYIVYALIVAIGKEEERKEDYTKHCRQTMNTYCYSGY